MRIAIIERQCNWAGQTQQAFLAARGLHDRGHELLVVCQPGSAIEDRSSEAGLPVLPMTMNGWRFYPSAVQLAQRLRAWRCDILHPQGARDHVLAGIVHNLLPGAALVRTKHSLTPIRRPLFYRSTTDHFVAVSRAARRMLLDVGIPERKTDLVHNGFDFREFVPGPADPDLMAELGLTPEHLVIGTSGRLGSKSKGIPVLIEAGARILDRLPEARLLLVGRTDQRLSEKAAQLGIADRVIFPGFRSDMPAMLSCMDIYVQPSLREALCSSLIEAMAMARPSVGSDVGGIPEVISDGETGLLCPPADPDALADAVLKLAADPAERERMGRRAREHLLQTFTLDRMVNELERVYRTVLRNRS